MRDSVSSAFKSFNTKFEGYLTFMYGDVKNLVTTGMGNLIDPVGTALSLPWVNTDGSPATQAQITAAWNAVKARTDLTKKGGGAYAGVTTIRLTDAGIDQLIQQRLASNESTLRSSYPDYDNWPADAQMAILSMAWAMGPAFNFPTFKSHVNADPPDFTSAATDSHMNDTGNAGLVPRNAANNQLFLNAADVLKYKADPDTLYYPGTVPQTGTTTTAAPGTTTTAAPATTTTATPATTTTAAHPTTTTAAPATTTTAAPATTTTAAPPTTTTAAPPTTTTAAPATTTTAAPATTTTAAPSTTTSAAPATTTTAPATTTSAAPATTTAAPAATTSAAPATTTAAPAATTSAAPATTTAAPAAATTAAPAATTTPAPTTTAAPPATTTEPSAATTEAPAASTTADPGSSTTAEPGASTTAFGDQVDTASSSGGDVGSADGGEMAAGDPPTVTGSITLDPDDGSDQNPQSYQVAESVKLKLKWSSTNADSVDIAGLGSGLDPSGEQDIPTADANYSITATGATGTSDPFDIEVHTHEDGEVVSSHVDLGADVAAIISFTANKDYDVVTSATVGDTITLIAIVSDATETVKINGADADLTDLPNGQQQAQVDVTIDANSDGNFDCQALKGGTVAQDFPQHIDIIPAPTTSTTSAPTTTAAPTPATTAPAAAATTTAAPAATTTVAPAAPPEAATTLAPTTTSTQSAEVSAAPDETTTASAEVSAAPAETTTASAEVSAAPAETTTASAEVSATATTTAAPPAPSTTTAAPATTTTAAPATTTTAAPATTTTAAPATTTTAAPPTTTTAAPPTTTTAAPATTTTAAPATTTTAAPATTTTAAPSTTTTVDSSLTPSGADWVSKFPTSKSVGDLTSAFQTSVNNFLGALKTAGAKVSIAATYRPPERGYLMHYAWTIAKEGADPQTIPAKDGVDILWAHKAADGSYDKAASVSAASAMVSAYAIKYEPSLSSRHFDARAIDMSISWSGTLKITDGNGRVVSITSSPASGQNTDLATVGASYGVHKLKSDPPHWSDDGH